EFVLGIPSSFWNNLETRYRERLALAEATDQKQREAGWIDQFPVREMVRQNILSQSDSKADQMDELLRFFAVSSPSGWENYWQGAAVAFRQSSAFAASPGAVSVWLRQGELAAAKISCDPFDAGRLRSALPDIRALTLLDPLGFQERLESILRSCGVALVFTRELPGTRLSGATRWASSEKALVQLSLRHRNDEEFWRTVFHELSHVLSGNKRQVYIHEIGRASGLDQDEVDAEHFANNQLVPDAEYRRIASIGDLTPDIVETFAAQLGISPGVLLGRLQRGGRIPWSSMNYLKRQFRWPEETDR
ncbi:MAG: ImmA/IrrE family metallo-endopeptidase, partial [Chloroflexota bacterium]